MRTWWQDDGQHEGEDYYDLVLVGPGKASDDYRAGSWTRRPPTRIRIAFGK